MSDLAIRVEELGKRYRLGAHPQTYRSLREHLTRSAMRPFQRLKAALQGHSTIVSRESIWALREVSFGVGTGEVVGVIGRNGAGKSTLLKILSRITEPTEGRAEIHGRVASLLEVGTGFHPELTGRENVYLNGAILGMTRAEIDRKFDEIVAFAEVERFLDTQVKHFSSGMYLRLAFAVAAHLEPEILLVDEVLAVGDASFQRKCLGQIDDFASSGRTVLFVSHNLAAVGRLCSRCILLDGGKVQADGPTERTLGAYSALLRLTEEGGEGSGPLPEGPVSIRDVLVDGGRDGVLHADRFTEVRCTAVIGDDLAAASLGVALFDETRRLVLHARVDSGQAPGLREPGRHAVRLELPPTHLAPGLYSLELKLVGERVGAKCRFITDPFAVQVANESLDRPAMPGVICPPCDWHIEPASPAGASGPRPGDG